MAEPRDLDRALEALATDRGRGSALLAAPVLQAFQDVLLGLADEEGPRRWPLALEAVRRVSATRPLFAAPGVGARRWLAALVEACGGDLEAGGGPAGWPAPGPGGWRFFHAEVARRERRRAASGRARRLEAGRRLLVGARRVLTASRSSQVEDLLLEALPERAEIFCLESLPGGEGRGLSAALTAGGRRASWLPDAGAATALAGCDAVLLGADAVVGGRATGDGDPGPLADGWRGFAPPDLWAVNKCGSLGLALLAKQVRVPLWIVAGLDKASGHPRAGRPGPEDRAAEEPGQAATPLFDALPFGLAGGLLCEEGQLPARALAAWIAADRRRCQVFLN